MLAGFASFADPAMLREHCIVGMPTGSRAQRLERLPHGWRLWLATRDFVYGTYLELFDDGRILHCTTRADEGDEFYWARPSDEEIRNK